MKRSSSSITSATLGCLRSVDGRTLTVHPFHPGASELSATVPIMCGSNETEGVPYQNPDDPFWKSEIADEGALRAQVTRSLRVDDAEADRLIGLYRKHRRS